MENIAIIGLGCRFPRAENPESYWHLLRDGIDAIKEVPSNRWHTDLFDEQKLTNSAQMNTRWGGFLEKVDQFDADFFAIAPREVEFIDPQQRLLLEVTYQALENAALAAKDLAGSATGVFIGISNNDYGRMTLNESNIGAYSATGSALCIAANRISYFLNLKGPSLAIDTACSSSLVAIHYACKSLQTKETNLCLAGGVNLILAPELTMIFSQANMMALDGRCKTFDDAADGYVRGEGCGIVVLKRLSDALTDGDNIRAIIRGTAVNQDGLTAGITAPNGPSQQAVIRKALKRANVKPAEISYVEAHGTGTPLGDPQEIKALKAVLMEERKIDEPCWISSVKTNIGHLESAAGIAGLIKVILSLEHKKIPPHLHLKKLNKYISLANTPLHIPTKLEEWKLNQKYRLAGVSSFGFGGTNAHVIVQEWEKEKGEQENTEQLENLPLNRPWHLLTLSAKSKPALIELASRYADYLANHTDDISLTDVCFTANIGRDHFNHRLAAIAFSKVSLQSKLADFAKGQEEITGLHSGVVSSKKPPKIAFLFTGQGSQYVGMGKQLYESEPIFRSTLNHCAEILSSYLDKPLLEVLYPSEGKPSPLDETAYTQPALFALEYALCKLWMSWGIKPSIVMGHSVGEYVAACVAGVFSLEDGLKLIAHRGKLMQRLPQNGKMVSVLANEATVRKVIEIYKGQVVIAAYNSSQSMVISGEAQAIESATAELEAEGVKTKYLSVSHAFHSPLMEPMLAEFRQVAEIVNYSSPKISIISNVTGEKATTEMTKPQYWLKHIRNPVKFAQGIKSLDKQEYEVFLEIGPSPVLLGMGLQCLKEEEKTWLPSLRPKVEDWQQLLGSLAKLYTKGFKINWQEFDKNSNHRKVILPNYPFQRERYWLETGHENKPSSYGLAENNGTAVFNLLNQTDGKKLVQQLEKSGRFSQEQLKLVPDILEILAQQQHQQLAANNISDWLYKVQWYHQPRFGRVLPPDYLLKPSEVEQKLEPLVAELFAQKDLTTYGEIIAKLEKLSLDYVIRALVKLGWPYQIGEKFLTEEAAQRLGIIPIHHRLFKRMLQMLAEVGNLEFDGQKWQVTKPWSVVNPEETIPTLLRQYPQAETEITLLDRCASKLSGVLRGAIDPVQLVFPQGDLTTATKLYQESPSARIMNTLVQQSITSALSNLPSDRGVRILEIGAGTGGTSSYILPQLNPKQTEYVFTDIGALFTTKAEEKFKDYSFIRYQTLDIEVDPKNQGFKPHQYDVIIAANVLHATETLSQTLKHIRQLLAPGGLLVLWEATSRQRWLDLIFGLLEGWWRFQDQNIRPDYPLLSKSKWQQLLKENGFSQVVALPEAGETLEGLSEQAVIIAQSDKNIESQTLGKTRGCLILADRQGVGQQLAAKLRNQGTLCTLVFAGHKFEQVTPAEFIINPQNYGEYSQLLTTVTGNLPYLTEIVHLWNLDVVNSEQLTIETFEKGLQLGLTSTLYLTQALIKSQLVQKPRLWLVTQGAQPVLDQDSSMPGLAQSPLWGMGRVISLEHPEFWGGMIDLEPKQSLDQSIKHLSNQIWDADDEDHIAFRNGQRYVCRLVSTDCQETQTVNFYSDSTYLITGGLGFLGIKLAQWLAEQGAGHIVLVSRREFPLKQDWLKVNPDSEEGKKIKLLQLLEKKGTTVTFCSADVGDQQQMNSIIEKVNTQEKPLRGVVHAAGITFGLPLEQIDSNILKSVLEPKIVGGWILHQLTKNLSLDFFISFSSAGSVWGAKGQADYDAANHFLDTLAYYRHSMGLPALTINWGNLGVGGMVISEKYVQWMEKIGLEAIAPSQGFEALRWGLSHNAIQMVVAKVDWAKFKQFYQVQRPRKLLNKIESQSEQVEVPSSKPKLSILSQLETAPERERYPLLKTYLKTEVANVLNRKDYQSLNEEQGFAEMGMDSLMAVELKNRLETNLNFSLPSTLAFEFPNISSLTQYIGSSKLGWKLDQMEDSNWSIVKQNAPTILPEREPESEEDMQTSILEKLTQLENLVKEDDND